MTVAEILDKTLRKIPENARFAVLAAYAVVVVGTQIAEGFSVDIHEGVYRTLVIIGGYLGVQSAANVTRES